MRVKENNGILLYVLIEVISAIIIIPLLFTTGPIALLIGIFALIYSIFWEHGIIKEINVVCRPVETDDSRKTTGVIGLFLLSAITFGIYYYVWLVKVGTRIKDAGNRYNVEISDTGATLFLWTFFGVWLLGIGPFVTWHKICKNLNKIAHEYNTSQSGKQDAVEYNYQALDNHPYESVDDPEETVPYDFENEDEDGATVYAAHQVVFNTGEYAGAVIDLTDNQPIVLGRDSSQSNLVFKDNAISKVHCTITWRNDDKSFHVHDYSRNGIYYENNVRLPHDTDVTCPPNTILKLSDGKNTLTLL